MDALELIENAKRLTMEAVKENQSDNWVIEEEEDGSVTVYIIRIDLVYYLFHLRYRIFQKILFCEMTNNEKVDSLVVAEEVIYFATCGYDQKYITFKV